MRVFLLLLAAVTSSAQLPDVPLTLRQATLRIVVAGDSGNGTEAVAKGISKVHAKTPLDAILLTGDNFYPCGVTSVKDPLWDRVRPLTRIGVPLFPVLGNHDYCGKADPDAQIRATGLMPNWQFPDRQYAVRSPVADFLFVETTPYVKGRASNLAKTIRSAFRQTPKTKWRVIVGHHPVISSGYHGYRPKTEVQKMRDLIPALRDARTDFYICGHDHHMELIRGRILHLVSGASSAPIPPIKLRLTTVFPSEIRLEPIGFAVVEINARTIRVRMYDGDGKARSEWIEGRRR